MDSLLIVPVVSLRTSAAKTARCYPTVTCARSEHHGQNRRGTTHRWLELTEGLGLQLVAKGADSPRHVRELRRLGCRYVRGYHFSAPLPAAEAAGLASSGWDSSWLAAGVLHA